MGASGLGDLVGEGLGSGYARVVAYVDDEVCRDGLVPGVFVEDAPESGADVGGAGSEVDGDGAVSDWALMDDDCQARSIVPAITRASAVRVNVNGLGCTVNLLLGLGDGGVIYEITQGNPAIFPAGQARPRATVLDGFSPTRAE